MKSFNNVKAIALKVKFHGNGCVNFDSSEQRFFLNKYGIIFNSNNNNMFAKKMFIQNEDGSVSFKYKVSSECLRHEIFKESIPFQNQGIVAVPSVFYSALSDPCYLMRGYMFTKANQNAVKKSSCLSITDAVEVGAPRQTGVMDFHSVSTSKEKTTPSEEGNDKSATSIYNIENVGEVDYEATGYIDLTELQFIPDDTVYDRLSFGGIEMRDISEKKLLMKYLSEKMVNMPNPQMNYYYMSGAFSKDEFAEYGLLLNQESVDMIIKKTLKGILDISIKRRGSYLDFKSMAVEVISDDGNETFEITAENLNDFFFGYKQKYFEASEELITKNRQLADEIKKGKKSEKKAKKSNKNVESNEE